MDEFFQRGVSSALKGLGMFADDAAMAYRKYQQHNSNKGQPYPEKTPSIAAERFAKIIRGMEEEEPGYRSPDNTNYKSHNNLDRLTSFSSPLNIDENRGTGGFMSPSNPRG
jgi:hypothetical protein